MADNTISIDLVIDGKGAVKEIRAAGVELDNLGKKSKKSKSDLQLMGDQLQAVGQGATSIGKGLTAGVTLPLTAFAAASVKAASDFESSFAGVKKTVDEADLKAVGLTFEDLGQSFRDLALDIPISVNELNAVGEAAGQLGIPAERLVEFTEVMAKLGVTTNLSATDAATALARFANITGGVANTQFANLGSTIVGLGNNFATTEAEIVGFGLRIAGAGNQVGLSQAEILGFGAALSSVGINAEAGGTAISRVFVAIQKSVEQGGEKLATFAQVAGLSADEFAAAFRDNAADAVAGFINGLSTVEQRGGSLFGVLEALEFQNVRIQDALLRSANAGDLLSNALAQARQEIQSANALNEEAAKRFETFESKLTLLGNRLKDVGIDVGGPLIDALLSAIDAAEPLIQTIQFLAKEFAAAPQFIQTTIIALGALAAAIGPLLLVMGSLATGAANMITIFGKIQAAGGISGLIASIQKMTSTMGVAGKGIGAFVGKLGAMGKAGLAVGTFFAAFELTRFILEITGAQKYLDSFADSLFNVQRNADGFAIASIISKEDIRNLEEAERVTGKVFSRTAEGVREAQSAMADWVAALRLANGDTEKAREIFMKLQSELKQTGEAAEEAGDDAEGAGGGFDSFGGSADEAAEAAKKLREEIDDMKASLGTAGLTKEINFATTVIREMGGVAALSVSGIESLARIIDEARKNSVELTPELAKVRLELDKLDLKANTLKLIDNLEAPILTTEEWTYAMQDLNTEFDIAASDSLPGLEAAGDPVLGGLAERTITLDQAMSGVNDILSEARGLMNLFGIEGDSALGKIIAGASKLFDTFNSVLGIADKIIGVFGGSGLGGISLGGGGGIFGALGGLFGGGGGGKNQIVQTGGLAATLAGGGGGIGGAAGGIGGALGGIGSGIGSLFSSLGSAAGALFTNPFGLAVLGGIGAFFGAKKLFGAIFGGESGVDQVTRIAAEDFGAKLPPELAKRISEAGGGETASGLGLFLEEIFQTGTQSVDDFAEAIRDVFNTDDTVLPFAERMDSINRSTDDLIANFGRLGAEGLTSVEQLLRDSQATGVAFEGMNELAAQLGLTLVDQAKAGGDAFLESINNLGISGRESLEFLRNEFGEALPADVRAAIDSILGIDQTLAGLPSAAEESVTGVQAAFQAGSEGISTALDPIAEKMATEIRSAGEETALAVDQSFNEASTAIAAGVGTIAERFAIDVAGGAQTATGYIVELARAAREAAAATDAIDFPRPPGGGGGAASSAASGVYPGRLISRETDLTVHAGEFLSVIPAGMTNRLRNSRSTGRDRISAANGFGGISVDLRGMSVNVSLPMSPGAGRGAGGAIDTNELVEKLTMVLQGNIGNVVEGALKNAIFEQR